MGGGRWAVKSNFKLTSSSACWLSSNALVMHMHGMRVTLLLPVECDLAADDQQASPPTQHGVLARYGSRPMAVRDKGPIPLKRRRGCCVVERVSERECERVCAFRFALRARLSPRIDRRWSDHCRRPTIPFSFPSYA